MKDCKRDNLSVDKKVIRLTESDFSRVIKECVDRYLRENSTNALNGVQYLYHATPACNVNSIKKYGLGGKIPKVRFWNYGGTPYEKITQGCFLATDEYVAESYVENSEAFDELAEVYEERYGKELPIVVFRIDVNDLDPNLLSVDTNQQYDEDTEATYFYNGVIPYNKLQKVNLYT